MIKKRFLLPGMAKKMLHEAGVESGNAEPSVSGMDSAETVPGFAGYWDDCVEKPPT